MTGWIGLAIVVGGFLLMIVAIYSTGGRRRKTEEEKDFERDIESGTLMRGGSFLQMLKDKLRRK